MTTPAQEEMKLKVFNAANQLNAAGTKPTLDKIRKIIGSGSFTTISSNFNEWKLQSTSQIVILREQAPDVIAQKLTDLGDEIWTLAIELANARLTTERASFESTRTALEGEKDEALKIADDLSNQNETLTDDLSRETALHTSTQEKLSEVKQKLMELEIVNAANLARADESNKRVGDLNEALLASNKQIDALLTSLNDRLHQRPSDAAGPQIVG